VRPAHGVRLNDRNFVGDEDFRYLVAVLRLCVPYTGLILTAREPPAVRRAVMEFGVSQIDAGTRVELAGYTADGAGNPRREQFQIGDLRSLDEVLYDLLRTGHLPSFCTSCYRSGRTGQHFMEYAVPGFIESFCTPNALLTLAEYIEDYAAPATREAGRALIEAETARIADSRLRETLARQLRAVREEGARDVHH
jgi:2-iminoacetate synthase